MDNSSPCSTPSSIPKSSSTLDTTLFHNIHFIEVLFVVFNILFSLVLILLMRLVFLVMPTPTMSSFALLKRLLRYIKGTIDMGLNLHHDPLMLSPLVTLIGLVTFLIVGLLLGLVYFILVISSHGL